MKLLVGAFLIAAALALAGEPASSGTMTLDPGEPGPFGVAQMQVELTNPATGSTLNTTIYYPVATAKSNRTAAPYAALVFAPGFLSPNATYEGNGQHLASWGYVVATIPDFPPVGTEALVSNIRFLIDYLAAANSDPASQLYGLIDMGRLGLVGHSRGGIAVLIATGRDARVKTVVALDPLTAGWDYEAEVPPIKAPLAIIAAPPQTCNGYGSYEDIFAVASAFHRAQVVITDASHCDFMDTENVLHQIGCVMVCGGSYDSARVQLSERYTTAWLNYYLRSEAEYYAYLYGAAAQQDIDASLITRAAHTEPVGVSASAQATGITLSWQPNNYPVLVGLNIYRSVTSGSYPGEAHAVIGKSGPYTDTAVIPRQTYHYVLRDRDAAGNLHMPSTEVQAEAWAEPTATATRTVTPTRTATPSVTATPSATATPTPTATPSATTPPEPTATSTAPLTPTVTATTTSTLSATPTVTATATQTAVARFFRYLPLIIKS